MDSVSLLGDAVSGLLGGLTQTVRLLRLHTPLGTDRLFAEDIEVWEGVGPCDGPALGDESRDVDAGAAGRERAVTQWTSDASLGPTRAGLRLVVHALSPDAHLQLKTLIGQPALVELLCQESRSEMRPWHGHVVAAALMGSDGGLARYRLVVEPWLAALAHCVDAWVFQDMSVPQILDEVFAGYDGQGRLVPAWRWDLADASVYPKRSLCIQYHESDLDFVLRLMREEGLVCWWEHDGDAASPDLGRHTLVIADHNGAFARSTQPVVRFTASDHTFAQDSLTRWCDVARVTSARVAMRSRDHRGLGDRPVEAAVGAASSTPSVISGLAVVDVPGAYAYEDTAQGERLARVQAQALAAVRRRGVAQGPWRRAQAGTAFTLADHPRHDGSDPGRDRFVVLAAQHRARNNLAADEAARFVGLTRANLRAQRQAPSRKRSAADDTPLHEAALLVQPLAVPVRMGSADARPAALAPEHHWGVLGADRAHRALAASPSLFDPHAVAALGQPEVRLNVRPTVRGTQTAIVVGNGDCDLHTDRDNRIRVQFHWQRGSNASHRLGAPGGDDNAPASGASFAWVRVGTSLAGANFGAVFTPRIGQEVLVAFTGGDIDRPVVIGAVYNGRGSPDAQGNEVAAGAAQASGNAPAWFPGDAPAGDFEGHRHGAVLLGHKSQELGASRSGLGGASQLVFDDSAGGNRIELSTTLQTTRLQLGALLQQQDNQRLAPRGHGLELATAAHGALRAGAGLLVSAHAQSASTATGQQLEARDPTTVLQTAQSLVHRLAASAQAHNARLAAEPPLTTSAASGGHGRDEHAPDGHAPSKGAAASQRTLLPSERGLQALARSLQGSATRGSANAGAAGDSSGAIDGGYGTVAAWSRPDLVLAAPKGIGLFTPAAAVLSAGAHITLSAGQDLHAVAQGHHASVAKDGVVLYTDGRATNAAKPNIETGIALHAASGSAVTTSHSGATRLTASGRIDVTSTKANVLVTSPEQVLLTAAGAAIRIEAGNITISAPGAVKFKAGMKVLTGPGSARQSLALQTPLALERYNEAFVVKNEETGDVLAHVRYRIEDAHGNVLKQGLTDELGRTGRVHSGTPDSIKLFLLDD